MKKLLLIAGGAFVLILLLGSIYSVILYRQLGEETRMFTLMLAQQSLEQQQAKEEADRHAVARVISGPTPVDIHGYKTEDNWIASSIAREIAAAAFLAEHPGQAPPDFKLTAEVDPTQPQVHLDLTGWGAGADAHITADLKPVFAWNAQGYAPWAQRLLSGAVASAPASPGGDDILNRLLNLTGSEIATEDVALSARLQETPASWSDHEAAALVLMALALRENAGTYQDNRLMLNRATAHLAVASALRGTQPETLSGLVAEAAILTLSGRELDARAALDALDARSDSPKVWISALRLIVDGDWREVSPKRDSPLLLKIAWFQVVARDLTDLAATRRLDPLLGDDPNGPLYQVPDWGRAVVANSTALSVENSQRFAQSNMPLELVELNDILKIEGAPAVATKNLAEPLSEPQGETTTASPSGVDVHVIGTGMFKAAIRRHLFADIKPAENGLGDGQGDQAMTFRSEMGIVFHGVPQYGFVEADTYKPWDSDPEGGTCPIEEAPVEHIGGWAYYDASDSRSLFFRRIVPFGTVYDLDNRATLRTENSWAELHARTGLDSDKLYRQIMQLPKPEQGDALKKFDDEVRAHSEKYRPSPLSSSDKAMLKLAPHQLTLLTQAAQVFVMKPYGYDEQAYLDHLNVTPEIDKILDYNLRYLQSLERWDLGDADHVKLLRKEVLLNPDAYFDLAEVLGGQGKEDEAAAMARKGVAEANDQVGVSDSVRALLIYDLAHGLNDEALAIGQRAADVGSYEGLESNMIVMEKLGRLQEAEKIGREIDDSYQSGAPLNHLYFRNPKAFQDKHDEVFQSCFPHGMVEANLASFSGKPTGVLIVHENSNTLRWGIHQSDVIVAVNGYKVESVNQYDMICALSFDPHLDLIIWKDVKDYVEVKVFLPGRRFGVEMNDYSP